MNVKEIIALKDTTIGKRIQQFLLDRLVNPRINKTKTFATNQGKNLAIKILKKSFLAKIILSFVGTTAIASAGTTLVTRTRKRLARKKHTQSLVSETQTLQLCIRSLKPTGTSTIHSKLKVTCGVLSYDMSDVTFLPSSTLFCDIHIGAITLILPDTIRLETEFHEFFGKHFCETSRDLTNAHPVLHLKVNSYLGAINVQWVPSKQ